MPLIGGIVGGTLRFATLEPGPGRSLHGRYYRGRPPAAAWCFVAGGVQSAPETGQTRTQLMFAGLTYGRDR
jgi:hypothetical protein